MKKKIKIKQEKSRTKFTATVRKQPSPLAGGDCNYIGKINSKHLTDFVGKKVEVKIIEIKEDEE